MEANGTGYDGGITPNHMWKAGAFLAFTHTGVEIELLCNMIPSLDTNAFSQHPVEERDPE